MLKFGNIFVNYGGTYLTGFVGKPSWVNVYSPTSGLFPGSGVGIVRYNNYIPNVSNPGEQWLDGTQDLFTKSVGVGSPNTGYANLSSNVQINLTDEMKSHDEYLLINYCHSPQGVSYQTNAYYNSTWTCEFGINDDFNTTFSATGLKGYSIKPDGRKAVSAYSVGINSTQLSNNLQYYFPNYSRDVKKFRFLIDMKNGNWSGYMTSSMIQDFGDATYKFTGSCDPITLGDTMNLSLILKSPQTITTGTNWKFASTVFGGFSMSAYKGPTPTEEEILSL